MPVGTPTPTHAYTPDFDSLEAPPAPVFYKLDTRRITLRERWNDKGSNRVLATLMTLFGVKLTSAIDDPCVETLAPFEVEASKVPGVIRQRFNVAMQQLNTLGFRDPIWHVIEDDVHRVRTYLATMAHESGRGWARIHNRVWDVRTPPTSTLFTEFVSEVADGQFVWTVSSTPDIDAPPSCIVMRDVGAPPGRLLKRHEAAVKKHETGNAHLVSSPNELRVAIERHHEVVRDFHRQRGLFVPVTADDAQAAVAFRTIAQTAKTQGSRYPEILAEIDRLQNAKSSKANGVLLLLASVGLFFAASMTNMGGKGLSLDLILILIPVLFFHEMGHWVTMRMFGYRNMKMFFIPFFGAAVSGRHYNVAGWKKAIVSLAGPLPGILVGAAIGYVGVMMHNDLLVKISFVALLLNGFNLLPILPLDGGWIVQTILFSRHHLLELAFRLTALAALLALAIASGDTVLIALGVVMVLSVHSMYKLARITNELRKAKLPPASDDGQTLPAATSEAIIGKVKDAFPAKTSNKIVGMYTLRIFENLNARPPGFFATIGLGILQFGSMAAVVVCSVMIFVGVQAGTWRKVDAKSIAVVRTPGDSALATSQNFLYAAYPKAEQIPGVLRELERSAPRQAGIERVGEGVIVALPSADVDGLRHVQTILEKSGAHPLVVSTPDVPARAGMHCTPTSPEAAVALERELRGYLYALGPNLRPPWYPETPWSAAERAQYGKARATYLRLRYAPTVKDPDTAVVSAYAAIKAQPDSALAVARADSLLGPLLGQLPLVGGRPVVGTDAWSVSGVLFNDQPRLRLTEMHFANAFQGAPVLARWLLANGCKELKYSFMQAK